jgi:hypothetical protein
MFRPTWHKTDRQKEKASRQIRTQDQKTNEKTEQKKTNENVQERATKAAKQIPSGI